MTSRGVWPFVLRPAPSAPAHQPARPPLWSRAASQRFLHFDRAAANRLVLAPCLLSIDPKSGLP